MAHRIQYMNQTIITTAEEEPWHARGVGSSGRKPPSFAYYTQVEIPNAVALGMAVSCLKELTEFTGAHYLWVRRKEDALERGDLVLEIWAHPGILEEVVSECRKYVRDCESCTPVFM